jgi:putative Mg2+ transporter-C (MgtC) family protein
MGFYKIRFIMIEIFAYDSSETMNFSLRVGLATTAGLLIGLEREYKGKHAGLKTNTLVAIGAAVFVLISLRYYGEDYADVTRVLSQVVTGIGFLGAGVILQKEKEDRVKGLTTAATLWCSAGAGSLAATSMFVELGILTFLVVIINIVFGYIDDKIEGGKKDRYYRKSIRGIVSGKSIFIEWINRFSTPLLFSCLVSLETCYIMQQKSFHHHYKKCKFH